MAFRLSPGVTIIEKDLTGNVPAVSTSTGAFVGAFKWGAVNEPVTVTSEKNLVAQFGTPTDENFVSVLSAANFLAYANNLLLVRTDTTRARNAVATTTGSVTSTNVTAAGSGFTSVPNVVFSAPQIAGGIRATGTAVLSGGGVTAISLSSGGFGFTSAPQVTISPVLGDYGTGAIATANLAGAGLTQILVTAGGENYVTPTVVISAPNLGGGVQATATATVSGGAIVSVTITNAGSGYTEAPTVTFTESGHTGDVATATASIATQSLLSITMNSVGSGYKLTPTVTISGGGGTGVVLNTVTLGTSTLSSIVITEGGSGYTSAPTVTISGGGGTGATATSTITSNVGVKINNTDFYLEQYSNGAGIVGEFAAKYPGALGNSITVSMADSATFSSWDYRDEFSGTPGTSSYVAARGGLNDELHIIVLDALGLWTGVKNGILEKYSFVSKASDARNQDGTTNYYKNAINGRSSYLWWMDHPTLSTVGANWGSTSTNNTFKPMSVVITRQLSGGVDDLLPTEAQLISSWDLLKDKSTYDISICFVGKASPVLSSYVIQNIAETRQDCVACVSPQDVDTGEPIIAKTNTAVNKILAYRNSLPSSSYGFMDTGWKYQLDKYNNVYRWVPLNADIAGLMARTDYVADPWFSPAGYTRGVIKNVIKLGFNPSDEADRDNLYKNGVNCVITEPARGVVLFGDKTLLAKPSGFDRINVRRLFIILEKAIGQASKDKLFEFNDPFTRAQFKNIVEPYLRDIQGRRGIVDFKVVCDETNNTPEVIDTNNFVGDIFIKANRSINFITLNFVNTPSGFNFSVFQS